MKKYIACILAAAALLALSACADASAGSNGDNTKAPAATAPPPVTEQPPPPESAPPAAPAPAELDREALAAFIEGIGLPYFAGGDIPPGENINEVLGDWGIYGLVTWALEYAYATQGLDMPSDRYYSFPLDELVQTANELFGGRCDFFEWVDNGGVTFYEDLPEGYIPHASGFCVTYSGEPDWDTLTYENGVAEITLAYESQVGTYWLTRFAFAPRPGNTWSPFELLWAEEIFTQPLIEPDVYFGETQYYVTTANLHQRRGPGVEYDPPMFTLPAGTKIYVVGKMAEGYEDWVYLDSGMSGGWVNTKYIEKAEP